LFLVIRFTFETKQGRKTPFTTTIIVIVITIIIIIIIIIIMEMAEEVSWATVFVKECLEKVSPVKTLVFIQPVHQNESTHFKAYIRTSLASKCSDSPA
jgi:hypothetical protein